MGKTKPAIDEMMELWEIYADSMELAYFHQDPSYEKHKPRILVAVPTEDLRDTNWPAEVHHWKGAEGDQMWDNCVTAVCYASMHLHRSKDFDLVILDECHHLTALSASFFDSDVDVMGLTATYPDSRRDPDKWLLLHRICPEVFTYSLDQGVDDGVVADFDIHIVWIPLDNVHKNIEAGPAKKRFMTTEAAQYNSLSGVIKKMHAQKVPPQTIQFMELKRRRFLCNLPSKLSLAKALKKQPCTDDKRTLIFCGSIAQANDLCPPDLGLTIGVGQGAYHSKRKGTKTRLSDLELFRQKEINTLAVVSAVNEGVNIPDLDQGIIVQMDSNERTLVQRLGRLVRWREGHHAQVWILVSRDTQDQSWTKKALENFDSKRISYHEYTEFLGN